MAILKYAIPGIGGSLGSCAVCGETFTKEILFGERIDSLCIKGINANLPVHRPCAQKVISMQGLWKDIREQRKAIKANG